MTYKMPNSPRQCLLEILAFHTQVSLGVSAAERATLQEVAFDVRIRLAEEPAATATDELAGTLCYAGICELVQKTSRERPYQLIESLARTVYEALRPSLADRDSLEISVHKLKPPVDGLRGGARFTYGDRLT